MNNSLLLNLKTAAQEIGQILSEDEILQRLLICDSADALTKNFTQRDFNTLVQEHYITFDPTEHAITENDKNNFLVITDNVISFGDTVSSMWDIHIVVDSDNLILADNKLRILEIADRIIVDLDDIKLSTAGQITVTGVERCFYSEFLNGRKISLEITEQRKDQPRKRAEI